MNRIAFKIEIEPKSLQFSGRRERIVQPKGGSRAFIHHYKDREAEAYERAVAALCLPYRPAQPFAGPVHLGLIFVMPRPQRLCRRKDPAGRVWCHDSTPDSTNLKKAAEDILTGVGFWHNDRQICSDRVVRKYAAKGERACIEVLIEAIPQPSPQGEFFSAPSR